MAFVASQASTAFLTLPPASRPQTIGTVAGVQAGNAVHASVATSASHWDGTASSCLLTATGLVAVVSLNRRRARAPAPSARVARCAFEGDTGVQAPVGFWDPLGLSASGNLSDYARRREVELKHGRICMAATIGYIVPEYYKFGGNLSPSFGLKFEDIPNGLGAFSKVPALGWLQIVVFAGFIEINIYNNQVNGEPGNYGAGFLGVRTVGVMSNGFSDPDVRRTKLNAELANGRLAMMAIIGMFFQDGLTGSAWGDWANYAASPLRAFEAELGAQAPVGFWDPLGLAASGDAAVFARRREVELKHGRVCMFATIGYMVPEYIKFPGDLSTSQGVTFEDIPNGLGAISKVPALGWCQILAFVGFTELSIYNTIVDGEPGNYGAGFLGLKTLGLKGATIADPEARKKKLNAEIANGRLAMMAIIGLFFQDGLTGSAWGDWANYTDSPLRAFEDELGVQAPIGFWDPAGFCSVQNDVEFKRRREVEIKHGRVSMLATIGYIVPEFQKFPGYVAPSSGIQFADVPNGLSGLTKVPGVGWAQMIGFCGFVELFVLNENKGGEPGNYGAGFLGLRVIGAEVNNFTDPEVRKKKLNAELANGRLAMMAIIGMFFQDGLTGSAWGDWASYTVSPLRAFEAELGVQSPVGFWDPAGFNADGDVAAFKRRRSVELKHGRICMLACMGYMTPEITGKFDGTLSFTEGLRFEDVPNGIGAISSVPMLGWLQIIGFFGFVEFRGGFEDYKTGTPGDYGWKVLSSKDPEKLTRKLQCELANGRLAMIAIMAMLFQNGVVGNTGDLMWSGKPAGSLHR